MTENEKALFNIALKGSIETALKNGLDVLDMISSIQDEIIKSGLNPPTTVPELSAFLFSLLEQHKSMYMAVNSAVQQLKKANDIAGPENKKRPNLEDL